MSRASECTIGLAETGDAVDRCFPVMAQLRPHLSLGQFRALVATMVPEGYRLAFVEDGGAVRAVAGFRVIHMLVRGRHLYVDDLVTDAALRSRGYGAALLDWLANLARAEGCSHLELDSGVQRSGAHRFYFARRMSISSYHFTMPLA